MCKGHLGNCKGYSCPDGLKTVLHSPWKGFSMWIFCLGIPFRGEQSLSKRENIRARKLPKRVCRYVPFSTPKYWLCIQRLFFSSLSFNSFPSPLAQPPPSCSVLRQYQSQKLHLQIKIECFHCYVINAPAACTLFQLLRHLCAHCMRAQIFMVTTILQERNRNIFIIPFQLISSTALWIILCLKISCPSAYGTSSHFRRCKYISNHFCILLMS